MRLFSRFSLFLVACSAALFAQATVKVSHANSYFRSQTNAVSLVRVTAPSGSTVNLGFGADPNFTVTRINAPAAWVCNLGTLACSRPDTGAAVFEFVQFIGTVNAAAPSTVTNTAALTGGGLSVPATSADAVPTYAPSKVVQWGARSQGELANLPTYPGFVALTVGVDHLAGLTATGAIVPWGSAVSQTANIPTDSGYVAIAAGANHTLALRNDGTIASWGSNSVGQQNGKPTGAGFIAVAAFQESSMALTNEGRIVTWGDRANNTELPTTNGGGRSTDGELTGIPTNAVASLAPTANGRASGAIKTDGTIAVWRDPFNLITPGKPTTGGFAYDSLTLGGAAAALLPLSNPTANGGNGQTTLVNQAFTTALSVRVLDINGTAVVGMPITFTAPGSGASGTFANATATVTVNTDASGIATASTFTANGLAGQYTVAAAYPGLPSVNFSLTSILAGDDSPIAPSYPAGGTATVAGTSLSQTIDPSPCPNSTVVTSTADSGTGSLRSAVAGACSGSTITFDPVVFATPQTITLASRILLNQDITIQGPANGNVTISGNNVTRIFFIGSGSLAPFTGTVNLSGLTLANGHGVGGQFNHGGGAAGMGGAIFQNSGTVGLSNMSFRSNRATGGTISTGLAGAFGGGGFGGDALLGNNAGAGGGDLGGLGGAASGGAATGDGAGGGGGINSNGGAGAFGGGGGGSAFGVGGAGGFGAGGGTGSTPGAFGWGAAAGAGSAGGPGAGFGGAVFVRAGNMTLTNVSFVGNSVLGGTISTVRTAQAKGGALFIYSGATVTANGVSFTANTAASAGAPGTGNSAAPYTNGATCPRVDNVDVCGPLSVNRLTVTVSGIGSVTGAGVNCPSESCTSFSAGTVTLTAVPASGQVLTGWSGGGCAGTSLTCTVSSLASGNQAVTATFGPAPQPVTVNVPAGVSFTLNGTAYTGSQSVNLAPGTYTLSTTTPQNLGAGSRAVFTSWSNNGDISQSITVSAAPFTITGNFTTQHQLTTAAGTGGTVLPATGNYYDAGTVVNVSATPAPGYLFGSWTGPVVNNTVTMDAPKSITANFTQILVAPNVTAQFTVTRGVPAFNRGTGRFSQVVTIVNNGAALSAAAYVVDNLAAGFSVFTPSGTTALAAPANSPYKELGALGAGASLTFNVEFTRVGTPALTYTPRILGVGAR